eukprot:CAMPEP_0201688010 /NCGR_PEP_ID=MMETSP0578-20130828/1805_1 /ASSEMBLY_ACC=CAM_ASM_000663 /TAXON_ID=267565 /ORGANISM="Skeletonema grethea, Strain CCMP 1804" /LENGTH=324 /DNA_ID=CAMNT_0048172199 /DNA_START=119 /DNA_END=1093 /DNA_ORIENTATION=-
MPMQTRPTSKRLETIDTSSLSGSTSLPAAVISSSSSSTTPKIPSLTKSSATPTAKPQRPLTAYHIFFQIEREYIIQTTAGPNPKDDPEKKLLRNVPDRYAATKLRPDWYAGPGKRQKRKHRKSHGKIGFFELSSLISTRWATLEQSHPDVKKFVHDVAAKELDEYKEEMERWKLAENIPLDPPVAKKTARKKKSASRSKAATSSAKISPPSSPKSSPVVDNVVSLSTSICTDDEEGAVDVDYSISSVTCNGHHVPSPPSDSECTAKRTFEEANDEDLSFLDPLFELFDVEFPSSSKRQRCVSPSTANRLTGNGYIKLPSQLWGM